MATEVGPGGPDGSRAGPGTASVQVRPLDRIFALYLAVTGLPLLLPSAGTAGILLLGAHIAGIGLVLGWTPARQLRASVGERWPRLARIVHDWYALAFVPALYTELGFLNTVVHGGRYYDPAIQSIEAAIFGLQPSVELAARLPYLALSELFHLGYLSYYVIVYVPVLVLYLTRRYAAFRTMMFGLLATFFVHYIWYTYFPVQGPRYLFPAPAPSVHAGPLYRLTHWILETGSSRGSAFPSSHMAVVVAVTVLARRVAPRMSWPVAVCAAGVALGAVYGGFHYAVDIVAGAALGGVVAWWAPELERRLS